MKGYLCTGTNKNKNLYVPLIYSGSLFNLYLIFVCNVYIVHVMYMMYYYVHVHVVPPQYLCVYNRTPVPFAPGPVRST
jgi:hypothetical protein